MKRRKTYSSQREEIAGLLQRLHDYKPARGEFSYAEHGRAVTEAHRLYNDSFQLGRRFPMDADLAGASTKAHQLWFTALIAAYPGAFWEDVQKLRAGDASGLESVIRFLEADPFFFGTGYEKVYLSRYIKPPMLTPSDIARLQNVVLHMVETRHGSDFGAYKRLAKKVDDAFLREQLTRRLSSGDADTQRRARWVLEALAQKDSMERGKQKKDAAARKQTQQRTMS